METKFKINRVYHQVIEYISNLIRDDELKKGDKLPTERELASKLGVSRNSIREALKTLDVIGLVDRRQGDGTFIKRQFDECFTDPLSIIFMLEKVEKHEILEFRNMIEIEMASLAAKRITKIEIEKLEKVYEYLVNHSNEKISAKYDKEFHYIIAKATKNFIVLNSYNMMSSLMDAFISDIRLKVLEKESEIRTVKTIHLDILEALRKKDPAEAVAAMKRHMDVINSYYS